MIGAGDGKKEAAFLKSGAKKICRLALILRDDRAMPEIIQQLLRFHLHALVDDGGGDVVIRG
jgi:hypothetical protein